MISVSFEHESIELIGIIIIIGRRAGLLLQVSYLVGRSKRKSDDSLITTLLLWLTDAVNGDIG